MQHPQSDLADANKREGWTMYLTHFGLTRFPFDRDIAAEDMFTSHSMRELCVRLQRLMELRSNDLVDDTRRRTLYGVFERGRVPLLHAGKRAKLSE